MNTLANHACRLVFFVAAAMTLAGAVSANDGKTFPGVSCQASGSTQDLYYGTTVIANRTNSQQSTVCPIVRDKPKGALKRVVIYTRDRHSTNDICCNVRAPGKFGTAGTGTASTTKCTSGEGDQLISFGPLAGSVPNLGPYSIVCSIPAMEEVNQPSYLASYRIVEP